MSNIDESGEILFSSSSTVWSKGDVCLAPWSGDGSPYKAKIKKLNRDDKGKFYATVKFCQYDSDDNEELPVTSLQKVQPSTALSACKYWKTRDTDAADLNASLFNPLSGDEDKKWLQDKFESADPNEEHLERLLCEHTKPQAKGKVSKWKINTNTAEGKTAQNKAKKVAMVTGGNPISNRKQTRKKSCTGVTVHNSQQAGTSTGGCTKHGGSSSDIQQREVTPESEVISDGDVDEFWKSSAVTTTSSVLTIDEDNEYQELKSANLSHITEAFADSDMEKPRLSFTPSAAKHPFQLSDPGEAPVTEVPATINQYLRDYQREGIKFLYSHYKCGRGAILGDDMGLGKTVEVIGLLAALLHKQGNRIDVMRQKPKFIRKLSDNAAMLESTEEPKLFLIIGPGSVLYNWLDELDTWGYFVTSKYHGTNKASCLADIKNKRVEIVVTTFETFRDNVEDLYSVHWDAVIVDEVHRIKGLKAQTTQALRTLVTRKRFGLTGTVLQNNMTELWSILDWAQPGVLGSYDLFASEFAYPIEKGQKHDATKRELAEARKRKEKFAKIRSNLMIRRTKKLIADQLPEKDDNVVFCKLSTLQVSVYRAILSHPDMSIVLRMNDKCHCGSGYTRGRCCHRKGRDGFSPMALNLTFMHLLMKVANHVALLIPHPKMAENQVKRSKEFCEIAFKDHPQFMGQTRDASFRTLSDPKYCGKMKVLQGLLSVFQKTHSKVLVFSYSTRLLDILEQYIIACGHEYRRIDGSVNNRHRMEIVREFNKDSNIFICLISTKAGGLGLNLTGANRVIIFDPNWNPSHDLQAQDRAYRIGQRKNVQVYRLISVGTIEENVYLRQVYKQQLDSVVVGTENAKRLFHGIQGDKMDTGELFGIKNMFKLRTGDSCLTMDVLQRNAKIEADLGGYDIAEYIPLPEQMDNGELEDEEETHSEEESVESDTQSEFAAFFDLDDSGVDELDVIGENESKTLRITSPDIASKKPLRITSPDIASKKPPKRGCDGEAYKNTSDKRQVPNLNSSIKVSPVDRGAVNKSKCIITSTDDEDLVAAIDESPPHSFSSVNSVFEQCGVLHVHDNHQVIGPSRAEEHMSRKAMQEVYELHQNSQVPAMQVEPYSESSEEETNSPPVKRSKQQKKEQDHNAPQAIEYQSTRILVGQTPNAIRRQHFKTLGDVLKFQSPLGLAELILSADTNQKLDILKSFYIDQHPDLAEVITKVTTLKTVQEVVTPKRTLCLKKRGCPKSSIRTAKVVKNSRNKPVTELRFVDLSDNESSTTNHMKEVDDQSLSNMEVGMKHSSHLSRTPKQKKHTTSMSITRLRKRCDLTRQIDEADHTTSVINSCDITSVDVRNVFDIIDAGGSSSVIEGADIDNLLGEIAMSHSSDAPSTVSNPKIKTDKVFGKTNSNDGPISTNTSSKCVKNTEKVCIEEDSVDHPSFSIVDNIFMDSSTIKKPPPIFSPKKKIHVTCESPESFSRNEERGFMSDLLNNSTLVDDSIDCFGVSRKRHKKPPLTGCKRKPETNLSDSDDDLDNLFTFKKKIPVQESKHDECSKSLGSESLFSF